MQRFNISSPSRRSWLLTAALSGALLLGACQQAPTVLTLTPAPISTIKSDNMVSIKGQVKEIFGSEFIVEDSTGRFLVDIGPKGNDTSLVKENDIVTAQGRFEHGVIHAQVLTTADGHNIVVGPPGPPPEEPRGPRLPHGPRDFAAPPALGSGLAPDGQALSTNRPAAEMPAPDQ